jgi:tetratricopeptide (TPR) repeat protein
MVQYLMTLDTKRPFRLGMLALKCAEKVQDPTNTAEACRILVDIAKDDMDYESSNKFLKRGLEIAETYGLIHTKLSLMTSRAWMVYQQYAFGDASGEEVERSFRELLAIAVSLPDWRFQGDAWSGLGQYGLASFNNPLIEKSIANLTTLLQVRNRPHLKARLYLLEAGSLYQARCFKEAKEIYSQTVTFAHESGLWSRQVDAHVGQGAAFFQLKKIIEANNCWKLAQSISESRCPKVRRELTIRNIYQCRKNVSYCPI